MNHIRSVLASYPIEVDSIEPITDRVAKIFDGEHTYALKKSRLTDATVVEWENAYHQANRHQLRELLPVYKTLDGSLATLNDQTYYYLMPWIPKDNIDEKQQIEQLYDTFGSIHAKTKQTMQVDMEKITEPFKHYQQQLKDHRSFLSDCIASFEQSRFMAPVELFFCTHYRDIDSLLQELDDQVARFISILNLDTKWNYSLCHGRLDFSHCLFGNTTYIMNWEDACLDNPIQDLSTLYHRIVTEYDAPADHLVQNFSVYMKQNPLTEAELALLSIYLLDPTVYIHLIKRYRNNPFERTQIDMIQQLQRAYRILSFALKWVHFTEDEEMNTTESDSNPLQVKGKKDAENDSQ